MGPQINFFVFQAQLAADVMAVKQDRIFGQAQQFGDFFVRFAFLDKVGDFDFHGSEIKIF